MTSAPELGAEKGGKRRREREKGERESGGGGGERDGEGGTGFIGIWFSGLWLLMNTQPV